MALPIRGRLTVWYSGVLALIIIGVSMFLVFRLRVDLVHGLDASLESRAEQIALGLQTRGTPDVGDAPPLAGIPRGDAVAQVLTADGVLRQSSGEAEVRKPIVSARTLRAIRSGQFIDVQVPRAADVFRVLVVDLPNSTDRLIVANSTETISRAVRRLAILLLLALPVAIGASGFGGYLLARRALAPVDRMTREAAEIGAHDTDARLDVPAVADEVGRLGQTLNGMLDRLHEAIVQQRRFAADASHELRTPLSVMQSEIDVALRTRDTPPEARPVLESLAEEVVRMRALVSDLLTFARADEGQLELQPAPVDLRAIIGRIADRFGGRATATDVRIAVDAPRGVIVNGDPDRLEQLVSNLVDNAIAHTPPGGEVHLSLAHVDHTARIEVADSGIGIPDADIPRIFDRFYRVDQSRSRAAGGTGLGLSICRTIARAHGGDVTVRSAPGEGSTFTVELPA